MKRLLQHSIVVLSVLTLWSASMITASCTSCSTAKEENTDSVAVADSDTTDLTPDSILNRTAAFYAGISCDGIDMSEVDSMAWAKYSSQISQSKLQLTSTTLAPMDTLMQRDMSDLRRKCKYVFYPFSGADFTFPYLLFPDADIYFMIGLENTGTPIRTLKTDFKQYDSYRNALKTYYTSTYFVTKDMKEDLNTDEINGTLPVISMLMASNGCEIISVMNRAFADNGEIVETDKETRLMEVKFCHKDSRHVQTLYYFSANINDMGLEENFQMYMDKVMPKYDVVTFLKAASYLMRRNDFVRIRTNILDHSIAVIQDDSGIPFRHFDAEKWHFTLYGKYVRPLSVFDEDTYQDELAKAYQDADADIRPLDFLIGYSRPSNWMVARRD